MTVVIYFYAILLHELNVMAESQKFKKSLMYRIQTFENNAPVHFLFTPSFF